MIDYGNELPDGRYVVLSVNDTGYGMDKETMAKIFDPYFTTKEPGQGTGLGLAVVHSIVKTHQGKISVYSELRRGATFNVYLPTLEGQLPAAVIDDVELPLAKAGERIMVVDDDPSVRDISCQVLAKAGYRAQGFKHGVKAWEVFSSAPDDWDLILTDQTMPGITGEQLAAMVLAIRPGLPVILCSGYCPILNKEQGASSGIFAYLQKPLTRSVLLTQVAKALE